MIIDNQNIATPKSPVSSLSFVFLKPSPVHHAESALWRLMVPSLFATHLARNSINFSRVSWSSMNSSGGLGCPQRQRGKSQCLVPATRNKERLRNILSRHSADRLEAIGQYDLGSFAAFATSDRSALASSFSLVASGHKTYRLRHIKAVTVERSELQHQDVAAMSKKANRQCSKPWWHSIILYTDGLAILPAYHQISKI